MSLRNTTTTYGSVARFFHWVIAVLIVFMLVYGYFLGDFPKDVRPITYNIHKLTGLLILSLMVLRLFWALLNPKPVLPFNTSLWERLLERVGHYALYFFAILMPLAGWIGSIAGGKPPHLGAFNFELPIAENKILDDKAFDVHNTVAIILIVLVSLHVLAAFYHHFIKKDNVLVRMMTSGFKR